MNMPKVIIIMRNTQKKKKISLISMSVSDEYLNGSSRENNIIFGENKPFFKKLYMFYSPLGQTKKLIYFFSGEF